MESKLSKLINSLRQLDDELESLENENKADYSIAKAYLTETIIALLDEL